MIQPLITYSTAAMANDAAIYRTKVSSFMEVNWSVTFTPAEAAFYFFGLLASWIVFIVNAAIYRTKVSSILFRTGMRSSSFPITGHYLLLVEE